MTLKDAVVLLVFPPLIVVRVRLWELYSVSRGTRLGVAPPDEPVVQESEVDVVEPAELDELFEVELVVEDESEVPEELDVVIGEVVEEEVEEGEPPLLSAKYAAAPPMATTTITTAAMTAVATPRLRLVIKKDFSHLDGMSGWF